MFETSDVDIACNDFVHIYIYTHKYLMNKCCPDKPWFTQGLVNACKKRINYTEISFGADQPTVNLAKYKGYRNKLTEFLRCEEKINTLQ